MFVISIKRRTWNVKLYKKCFYSKAETMRVLLCHRVFTMSTVIHRQDTGFVGSLVSTIIKIYKIIDKTPL